jgi:hypothetical protein
MNKVKFRIRFLSSTPFTNFLNINYDIDYNSHIFIMAQDFKNNIGSRRRNSGDNLARGAPNISGVVMNCISKPTETLRNYSLNHKSV